MKVTENMRRQSKFQRPLLLRAHLWEQVLLAMVSGIGLGLILSPSGLALLSEKTAYDVAQWVAVPGQLFLAVIQMVVIPLVISSIILGVTNSEDTSFVKKAGLRIVPYFVVTTTIALVIGIVVTTVLRPGDYIDTELVQSMAGDNTHTVITSNIEQQDISLPQRVMRIVPENPSKSLAD